MTIGICILATNAYFVLGVRFIRKFLLHYKGEANIEFYFFSDEDPQPYINEGSVIHIPTSNIDWVDGTNSKFRNILSLRPLLDGVTHLFYFDADTNISKPFTEQWFIGDSVGGEHYGNRGHMQTEGRPFDRNPASASYIPRDTPLPQMYYYGAFFGGTVAWMLHFCKQMVAYQQADGKIGYEPAVNDESYINRWFHYAPPSKVVATQDFEFIISDKGGLEGTRNPKLDLSSLKEAMLAYKNSDYDIRYGGIYLNQ